jgi:transcription antitermination factor NusG
LTQEKEWFVVYTKPRWEKKIALILLNKGIENYCPLNKVTKQWTDRKKVVEEPLFKGYIFICPNKLQKWDIKKVPGILNYVHWLGKPAVVKESEINVIKKFLHEFDDVEVSQKEIAMHETVQVKQGLMMNYRGIVLEVIGSKAKVKIDSMGIVLTAVFEQRNLEKINN